MRRTKVSEERLPELAVSNTDKAIQNIKESFDGLHLDRFRRAYGKAITESGNDVAYESVQLAKLAAMAVAQYNGLAHMLPRYRSKSLCIEDAERVRRQVNDFVATCEKAEMKALWLNRVCNAFTGRFFFRGKLSKKGQSFRLDEMYGLVHNVFQTIDAIN